MAEKLDLEKMELGGDIMMEVGDTTTTMKSLPQELIVDILSRLPAVHLWPLRCVCKPWFRLIARDPRFAKSVFDKCIQLKSNPTSIIAWTQEPPPPPPPSSSSNSEEGEKKMDLYLVTHHTECDKATKLNLPFLNDREQEDVSCCPVYGICNGMLCLSHVDKHEVYIWNPLTNDHITIPYTPTPLKSSSNEMSTLFGFAFLQSTNQYKVIKLDSELNWEEHKYNSGISSYTLGDIHSSSWTTVLEDMPYGVPFTGVPCPQVNGYVHWLARKEGQLPIYKVLAFDLKHELLYEIDPPMNLRCDMRCIRELGGLLCFFNAINKQNVDIWTMEHDYSWKRQFKIGTSEVVGDFSILVPLGVVAHSGDIVLIKNTLGLITYNKNTKAVTYLKEFGFTIINAHAYFASIFSPRAISGAGCIRI